jgi:hypothetical protein
MKVTNWGLFLLGVYLVLAGLSSVMPFVFIGLTQIASLLALVAGILIIMDTWRR